MKRPTRSSPHQFLQLSGITILCILLAYLSFILFPAYAANMYLSSDPKFDTFNVPFYPNDATGMFRANAGLLILTSVYCFLPLFTVIFGITICMYRKNFSGSSQRIWILILAGTWLALVSSFPLASAFARWLAD